MLSADERRCLAPRAPATCGHLFCSDCVESALRESQIHLETVEGVQYAVPDDQLKADDVVRDRPYLMVTGGFPSGLHNRRSRAVRKRLEVVRAVLRLAAGGAAERRVRQGPARKVILASREQEDRAAQALRQGRNSLSGADFSHYEDEVPPIRRGAAPPHAHRSVCPAVQRSLRGRGPVGPRGRCTGCAPGRSLVRGRPQLRADTRATESRAARRGEGRDGGRGVPRAGQGQGRGGEARTGRPEGYVFCDQAESVPLVVAALEASDVAAASFTGAASRREREGHRRGLDGARDDGRRWRRRLN